MKIRMIKYICKCKLKGNLGKRHGWLSSLIGWFYIQGFGIFGNIYPLLISLIGWFYYIFRDFELMGLLAASIFIDLGFMGTWVYPLLTWLIFIFSYVHIWGLWEHSSPEQPDWLVIYSMIWDLWDYWLLL